MSTTAVYDFEVNTTLQQSELLSIEQYAKLDENDIALNKWKASLGLTPSTAHDPTRPPVRAPFTRPHSPSLQVQILSLSLHSPDRQQGPILIDLTHLTPENRIKIKSTQLVIKEFSDYSVQISFLVNTQLVSGLRYLQVTSPLLLSPH